MYNREVKIGITHKLFLSMLAAASLALLSMFIIMQWSINRGFFQYLGTLEQERLEQLVKKLEQLHAEHGSWNVLREDPRGWIMRLMDEKPHDGEASLPRPQREIQPFPQPRNARGPRFRFIILDADRNPVVGGPAEMAETNLRPIIHEGRTVGYAGLLSPKHFLNPQQVTFLKQQKSALILAAFGVVLVVAIFSIPLANRLVRPIRALATATHDLALGKYSVRVPVSSSDELGRLARDFNEMALILEKNEKARRQWVADISHELRTPLSVLRGEIEALLEGIRDITPAAVRSLHAEVIRLHRLVDDLYQLALSDLGTLTYRKENLDLTEILMNSLEPYGAEFARKGITLATDMARGSNLMVFADAERMHQLFSNLLDNSLKYTDGGGKLIIRLTRHDNQAIIDFEDSAPGVPAIDLERLFERLYRVEGSRSRATGGAGLGLAICRNIVEAHLGSITAHPSPLGGMLIRIALPIAGESL